MLCDIWYTRHTSNCTICSFQRSTVPDELGQSLLRLLCNETQEMPQFQVSTGAESAVPLSILLSIPSSALPNFADVGAAHLDSLWAIELHILSDCPSSKEIVLWPYAIV